MFVLLLFSFCDLHFFNTWLESIRKHLPGWLSNQISVHLKCLSEIQQLSDPPNTHEVKCKWSPKWWSQFEPSTTFGFQLWLGKAESNLGLWWCPYVGPQQAKWGFRGWLCGGLQAHPSIDIMILVYSHMLTHWTRVEIVCDVLVSWLCLVPPLCQM